MTVWVRALNMCMGAERLRGCELARVWRAMLFLVFHVVGAVCCSCVVGMVGKSVCAY
jgi:hypothetical protein